VCVCGTASVGEYGAVWESVGQCVAECDRLLKGEGKYVAVTEEMAEGLKCAAVHGRVWERVGRCVVIVCDSVGVFVCLCVCVCDRVRQIVWRCVADGVAECDRGSVGVRQCVCVCAGVCVCMWCGRTASVGECGKVCGRVWQTVGG
jgi:hypothetical protein